MAANPLLVAVMETPPITRFYAMACVLTTAATVRLLALNRLISLSLVHPSVGLSVDDL
jgi:hypothetical protein